MLITSKLLLAFCLTVAPVAQADAPADPRHAAASLLARLLPNHVDRFVFETIPPDQSQDVFEIESAGPRIVIRGNNGVAMAMGLNWYLKHFAHCHVSWYGNQLNLPDPLPPVQPKVRHVCWARYRYFLNYCCFGYSLPWWDWAQWEKLIDWMALNGVNMPLSVTGQEAVWQPVCRRLGMDQRETAEFLAGPPYLPFQWMGCLDGYGGPLSQRWIAQHEDLEKKILARQRELGMTPVLQGFTGHVPASVARSYPDARLQQVKWVEWKTRLLDPTDPLFAKIARMFLEEQTRRYGTDHLYAADTFIEMTPPNGDLKYLADLSRAIYDGMAATDPKAIWVLQGWPFMFRHNFWTPPRVKAFFDAIANDRMVVLDLFCETKSMYDRTEAFYGKPWLWCNVQNFGRGVYLGGNLDGNNHKLHEVRRDPKSGRLAGLGFVNEGLCYNPVVYDLMFEAAWRDQPVDLDRWIADYTTHRYGRANAHAQRAWCLLLKSVYSTPASRRAIVNRAPALDPTKRQQPLPYDGRQLADAWRELLLAGDELGAIDTYRFDLVNVARQAIVNRDAIFQRNVAQALQDNDAPAFKRAASQFLELIRDLDELLGTRQEFLLGCWLEDAKRWGETDAERAVFEWNARNQLTLWGEWNSSLRDYACKEWSGMLSSFYAHRWQMLFDRVEAAMASGQKFNPAACDNDIRHWEASWTRQTDTHPAAPQGNSIEIARRLWAKYGEDYYHGDAVSLTTGKPATCSHALPGHPPTLANDGQASDSRAYWATDVSFGQNPWWQVDLEKPTTVSRVVVVGYYADKRYYGFTVEASLDGQKWDLLADRRDNKEPSTARGYVCNFPAQPVRYLRITQTHCSANTGRHLVEVMAYEK